MTGSIDAAFPPDTSQPHFSGSFDPRDVHILLKPSAIQHVNVAEKERMIQSGIKHYSEMLSPERVPDSRYMTLYHAALERNAGRLRGHIETLARGIIARPETQRTCVIISLARAGTPIGVLLKRALERIGIVAHHYSISIIRGRGIDRNALQYIFDRHGAEQAIFLDGWTGKGAIRKELDKSVEETGLGFQPFLTVVADPAGQASLAATTEDYVIPSGLLNGIVSGLISRSVLTRELVGSDDFHACLFQQEHRQYDITNAFLSSIEAAPVENSLTQWSLAIASDAKTRCQSLLQDLMQECGISDVNRIKPGIAEATRAILRRVPEKVFVKDLADPEIQHMRHLAVQSGVDIVERNLLNYRAVSIIKKLGGDQE